MFLKIIREVQTTKGTLLFANWKVACTSQGMTDFEPVVGQHTSHLIPRCGSLPIDRASPSPTTVVGSVCSDTRQSHTSFPPRRAWQAGGSPPRQQPRDVQEMDFFWLWMVTSGPLTIQAGL